MAANTSTRKFGMRERGCLCSSHRSRRTTPRILFSVLVLTQASISFGWSARAHRSTLFARSSRRTLRRVPFQESPANRRGARVWGSPDDGEDESHSQRRSLQGSIASLMTRVVNKKKNIRVPPKLSESGALKTNGEDYDDLKRENELLRETVRQLELENEHLHRHQNKIIIENFEGEGRLRSFEDATWFDETQEEWDGSGITMPGEEIGMDSLWCDELEDGQCPVEPTISFGEALRDRALWLVGLLALQSCSGFILSRNELLLAKHPVIVYFLTMLVGAGGNAGNQASVRVIRGLALGTLNERTQRQFLSRELKMAASLCCILSTAGFLRAAVFRTPFPETVAVTSSLALIVFSSVCLGAVLPLLLKNVGVDPAHSSTTIQVVMDILGVVLTVIMSTFVLESPLGQFLATELSAG